MTDLADWEATVAEFAAPIVAGGVVYLGCDPGSFCALDATNGALRWKTLVSNTPPHSAALVGDVLYVADTENHAIRAVDLKAGRVTTVAVTISE